MKILVKVICPPWYPRLPRRNNSNLTPALWAQRAKQAGVPYDEPKQKNGPELVVKKAA